MEIDKYNFREKFDFIKKIIDESDFIAFDTELTGLHVRKLNYFGSPELRYEDLRKHSMQYAITQFGICAFKVNYDTDCVSVAPVNFHLLPHCNSEKDNFAVNTDTIKFLNAVKFDFNKSWRDGVPTMRLSEFHKLNDLNYQKMFLEMNYLQVNDTKFCDFSALTSIINDCEGLLNEDDKAELLWDKDLSDYDSYVINEHLATKVGCINGNWIFPIFEYNKEFKKKVIRITKCTNYHERKKQAIIDQYNKYEKELREKMEFSDLIKYIGDAKKFLIGHNCLLDCLHMYDNFIGPLPQDYKEFKTQFHTRFPNCIDTKYLVGESKHEIFTSLPYTSLQRCYEATNNLTNNPIYKEWDDIEDFKGKNMFHTAHYDAMITGKLFLNLITEIAPEGIDLKRNFQSESVKALSNYNNKFNVVYADIKTVDLNPSFTEDENDSERLFHMTIPDYWRKIDILIHLSKHLKKPLRFIFDKIHCDRIENTSVAFKVPDEIQPHEVPLGTMDSVTITTFNQHLNLTNNSEMEGDGFTMAKEAKRRRTKI